MVLGIEALGGQSSINVSSGMYLRDPFLGLVPDDPFGTPEMVEVLLRGVRGVYY